MIGIEDDDEFALRLSQGLIQITGLGMSPGSFEIGRRVALRQRPHLLAVAVVQDENPLVAVVDGVGADQGLFKDVARL